MTVEVKKVISGLNLWDVIVNGEMVERFDTKWEANEYANEVEFMIPLWAK